MRIKFYKKTQDLEEIYSKDQMKFAFINKQMEMCTPFVMCRDFLQDAFRGHLTNKKTSIYGFSYDPCQDPDIDTENIRIIVADDRIGRMSSNTLTLWDFQERMEHSFSLIRHYEKKMGIKEKTYIVRYQEEDKYYWVFIGPKEWLQNPFFISLYTLLIRLGEKKFKFHSDASLLQTYKNWCKKSLNSAHPDNDTKYLQKICTYLDTIIENRKELFFAETDSFFSEDFFIPANIMAYHNYSGIVSLCKKNTFNSSLNHKLDQFIE